MRESHTQYPKKVNVSTGKIGDHSKYLKMFRDEVVPVLSNLFPNVLDKRLPNANFWFQQDGATPQYAANIRDYLNVTFPNKWIGQSGTIQCPITRPNTVRFSWNLRVMYMQHNK